MPAAARQAPPSPPAWPTPHCTRPPPPPSMAPREQRRGRSPWPRSRTMTRPARLRTTRRAWTAVTGPRHRPPRWAAGPASAWSVAANGAAGFDVSGPNASAEDAPPAVGVRTAARGATETASSTASVADAALHASAKTVTPTEGAAFSGVVASFTDDDPAGTATDYTASITWGDGHTSAGTAAANTRGTATVRRTNTASKKRT